jgi:colicin import membrane protein
VAGIHAVLLAVLVSLGWVFKPKTDERFLEMIDLGNAGFNPVADTSEPPAGGGAPLPAPAPAPKPQPPKPPAPKPAETKTPEPVPPPKPPEAAPKPKPAPVAETPVKPSPTPKTPAVEAPKPAPSPSASTKPKINVNTTLSQKPSGGTAASASPASASSTAGAKGGGPSSEQIREQLASGLGKVGGNGNPSAGSPSGTKGANTYKTVIRDALYRNWHVPGGSPPTAVALLRIYADGRIEFRSFASSSGSPEVDESIVTAVKNTGILPKPPPPGLADPHYDVEVTFEDGM